MTAALRFLWSRGVRFLFWAELARLCWWCLGHTHPRSAWRRRWRRANVACHRRALATIGVELTDAAALIGMLRRPRGVL